MKYIRYGRNICGLFIDFIKSCSGHELIEFWEKEVRIRFADIAENIDLGIVAQAAHTYAEIIEESNKSLI